MDDLGSKLESLQVFMDPLQALGIGIDGDDSSQLGLQLQKMGRLATGSGTGIEDPVAGLWGE